MDIRYVDRQRLRLERSPLRRGPLQDRRRARGDLDVQPDVRARRERPLVLSRRGAQPDLSVGREDQRRARRHARDVPLLAGVAGAPRGPSWRRLGRCGALRRSWTAIALVLVALALLQACGDSGKGTGPSSGSAVQLKLRRVSGAEVPANCGGVYSVSGPGVNINNKALPDGGQDQLPGHDRPDVLRVRPAHVRRRPRHAAEVSPRP